MMAARGNWNSPATILSVSGLSLAVASLVVAMGVVSGFKATLESALRLAAGDLTVIKRGSHSEESLLAELNGVMPRYQHVSPFVMLKAVFPLVGRARGVLLEGVDPQRATNVTAFKKLLVSGRYDLNSPPGSIPKALVGKEIAAEFGLKVGSQFRLVLPISLINRSDFRTKIQSFELVGILHFGHHEFDSRYIVTDLSTAQVFGEIGDSITGLKMRFNEAQEAVAAAQFIQKNMSDQYHAESWRDIDSNLFEAADLEKVIIFFVLLVIVIAAAFLVMGTLYVLVLHRFRDISILRTLGASPAWVMRLFLGKSLAIATAGCLVGFFLGLGLCYAFYLSQARFGLILGEIYKIDHIELKFHVWDFVAIAVASFAICLAATYAPARKGAKLSVVDGLRYE